VVVVVGEWLRVNLVIGFSSSQTKTHSMVLSLPGLS
jgi:hypothetical protein